MRVQTEDGQQRIGQSERIGIEDPAPDHRDQDRRVDQGKIEERAVESLTFGWEGLEEPSDDERERDLRGDDNQRIQDGVADRLQEDGVASEAEEVAKAREGAADDGRV